MALNAAAAERKGPISAPVPMFASAAYENMDVALFAATPADAPLKRTVDEDWGTVYSYLETRRGSLRSWRWSWWTYWRVLAQFFDPKRYVWLVTANRTWRGHPLNESIVDSTGQLALRTCAGGMWSGLTSPVRPWFELEQGLPWATLDADAQDWFGDTNQRLRTMLQESNFYSVMAMMFRDLAMFGTSPVIIYEDHEDIFRLYLPAAGEYYLQAGGRLDVTTLLREFTFTVGQIVQMFRLENCPQQVQSLWRSGSFDTEFVVCHMIEPNVGLARQVGSKGRAYAAQPGQTGTIRPIPSRFPFREIYWIGGMKADRPLSKRGFNDKPFVAFRWSEVSNDAYGRGPCMDALGDVKQVQLETRHKAEYIVKGVRPPMGADPALKNEPMSITPGGVTFTSADSGKKGFWPLFEVSPNWLVGLSNDIETVNKRVQRCLFVDLFMAITNMQGVQPRNELELTQRNLERLQELGPVITLVEKELSAMIRRIFSIAQRRRLIKPMPESLLKFPLKISYTSTLSKAQRASETVAMKDVLSTAGSLSEAAKAAGVPDPLRIINLEKSLRHYGDIADYPMDCFWTDEQVQQHDQAREQAKAQAQVPPATMAAVSAAHTLSQTQVPGGNALNAILTGQTGGG